MLEAFAKPNLARGCMCDVRVRNGIEKGDDGGEITSKTCRVRSLRPVRSESDESNREAGEEWMERREMKR